MPAEFNYALQPLGKQLRAADRAAAAWAVILGDETRQRGVVQVKDLRGGGEREVFLSELLADPSQILRAGV